MDTQSDDPVAMDGGEASTDGGEFDEGDFGFEDDIEGATETESTAGDAESDLSFDQATDDPATDTGVSELDDPFDRDDVPDIETLEARVEQLEDEIANVSSTVSTVRTENEQISDSVDEIEENIRRLLEIYKEVTEGANPFVDQAQSGAGGQGPGDTVGLFEDSFESDQSEQNTGQDDSIMEADADEFFQDDENADDLESVPDDEGSEEAPLAKDTEDQSPAEESSTDDHSDAGLQGDFIEAVPEDNGPQDPSTPTETTSEQAETADSGTEEKAELPYLPQLPNGINREELVLDWIDMLINSSSPQEANTALTYYHRIGWIGAEALEQLQQSLRGHPDVSPPVSKTPGLDQLTVEHHRTSLQYIVRLDSDTDDYWRQPTPGT